jgi:predicted RNA-binding protein with PUA-like domain
MSYWLIKSEPNTWSWNDQKKVKTTMWDGVRNYQARNNLMQMKKNDLCFFYHSVKEKQIIGIVKVSKEFYQDPTDISKKFVVVDVDFFKTLTNPVTLEMIKKQKKLSHLALIKQSRLSVMPIDKNSWNLICLLSKNA